MRHILRGGTPPGRTRAIASLLVLASLHLPAGASPRAATLAAGIRSVLGDPRLAHATVAVHVETLVEGRVLFSVHADLPLVPGSNMKLLTTAAALDRLGPSYRFRTEVRAAGTIRDGVLLGDLLVVGGGDPLLSGRFHEGNALAPLDDLAGQIEAAGVRRVEGGLLLDASFFDDRLHHPSWSEKQFRHSYCAPISALALNDNCVDFEVRPGQAPGSPPIVAVQPGLSFLRVSNEARTVPGRSAPRIDVPWGGDPGSFRVRGTIAQGSGPCVVSIPVRDPVEHFGRALREVLEARGILVAGAVRQVGPRPGDAPPPAPPGGEARVLAFHESSLRDAVTLTNERSQNFCAEQILKTLGGIETGRGSFEAGARVVREFVEGIGIRTPGIRIADGSGLSHQNRFPARGFVTVLRHMMLREPSEPSRIFFLSLPVSGIRGSLRERLRDEGHRGRVAAKTGYVRGASALAGFARCRSGETVVFSILMNRFAGSNADMKGLQDRIAALLVDRGGAGGG